MDIHDVDIDKIVHEVLNRLGGELPANNSGALVVSERVLSTACLSDRLGGIRQVIAPRGAVVTPAARDLLNENDISLTFRNTPKESQCRNHALLLANGAANLDRATLVSALEKNGVGVEEIIPSQLIETVDRMTERIIKERSCGAWITSQAAAALCLANRVSGIRAASAGSLECVRHAVRSIGANLLIIDAAGKSRFQIVNLIKTFVAESPGKCPPAYVDRLG